ncbi:hypothetical protein MWN34_05525 [Ancylobacter sp. 6x-1]|uniref:DUF2336 domain-containing protein n=1 Tax=Ancylobacter crimeensis TaxID=2579147 RepID=A0ABT0D8U0_9HYPH|nr:hypothetical protein [Ancylobacter crimeensis]MCK0196371.1 hypothetical protein [Ancylobacter crimeensis]
MPAVTLSDTAAAEAVHERLRAAIDEAHREGRDTRPLLLRLLAIRASAEPPRNPVEQRRLSQLILRLIEAADTESRAFASATLARRADLPREVALRLAQEPIEVAEPMLRLSPALDEDSLRSLAQDASPAHANTIAAAIAARRVVSPGLARHLAETLHQARSAAMTDGPLPAPDTVSALQPSSAATRPLPQAYLRSGRTERAAILEHLVTMPPLPMTERVPHAGSAMVERLEQAIEARRSDEAVTLLSLALRTARDTAQDIAQDRTGEALIVAARALGLSFELASRLVFLLHPELAPSTVRVLALAELYEQLPDGHAQHLAAAWRAERRRNALRPTEALAARETLEPRRMADIVAEPQRRTA